MEPAENWMVVGSTPATTKMKIHCEKMGLLSIRPHLIRPIYFVSSKMIVSSLKIIVSSSFQKNDRFVPKTNKTRDVVYKKDSTL